MSNTTVLDVFKADAFTNSSMTDAVNHMPYVPKLIGGMGLFESEGVPTTTIQVESINGSLGLIPNTLRGAPPRQNIGDTRAVRNFTASHFPLEDTVMASEVQNIRDFGATSLMTITSLRDRKLQAMLRKHDATLEYQRIGAIKGIILDADGSTTVTNLFTEFGLVQTSVDFVLGTAGTNVKDKTLQVAAAVEEALGGDTYQQITVFCGKTWFAKFVNHAEVKAAYERWQDGQFLRSDQRYSGFEYCGVRFVQYRGAVNGVSFIPDSEAYAVPTGVPGLFKTYFAPADHIEYANQPGLPRYAFSEPMEYGRGLKLLTESNPLSICRKPAVLIKLTTSN